MSVHFNSGAMIILLLIYIFICLFIMFCLIQTLQKSVVCPHDDVIMHTLLYSQKLLWTEPQWEAYFFHGQSCPPPLIKVGQIRVDLVVAGYSDYVLMTCFWPLIHPNIASLNEP